MKNEICYIGLGSNLDDPISQIQSAVTALGSLPDTSVCACSGLWASKPMGPSDQPDYVNAAVGLTTSLSPQALLEACQGIESAQRRIKTRHWGPRTIDLDILLFGQQRINTPHLTVPHPGVHERSFVLAPLQQIAPHIQLSGHPIDYWLANCDRGDIHPIAPVIKLSEPDH